MECDRTFEMYEKIGVLSSSWQRLNEEIRD